MTQPPLSTIPQTQDELRGRFVAKNLKKKLIQDYDCIVTDPFNLGLDLWGKAVEVRREEYRDRKSKRRMALIYWTNDEKRELIVSSLVDEGLRYVWNFVPASTKWSTYDVNS
jgi:hypothetical protein